MRSNNGRLVAIVAAVAVAAVSTGAAIAYRQGPQDSTKAGAAPLSGTLSSTPTPTPTPKPSVSSTPTPTPKSTPSNTPRPPTGPIALEVARLPKGGDPKLTYRFDRAVLGGPGPDLRVPGSGTIEDIVRFGDGLLVNTVSDGGKSELLKLDAGDVVSRRTPDIWTVTATADGSAAAYADNAPLIGGEMSYGATLYSERGGSIRSVLLPTVLSIKVMAYTNGKVYYQASVRGSEKVSRLYTWTPGAPSGVLQKKVPSGPRAVSSDGRLASSMPLDDSNCATVVEIATGKKLYRNCEYAVTGFTPGGKVAIATPSFSDGCSNIVSALDARTGAVLRQWSGCFYRTAAEDDQHILMVAVVSGGGQAPVTKSAIVRCAIDTGACERATDITTADLVEFAR